MCDKPGQCAEKQDTTLLKKGHIVKAMVFPVVTYSCENWTIKKAEKQKKIECLSIFTAIEIQGGASGKESAPQCRMYKRCRFNPWVRKISWSRKCRSTPVCLTGKLHEQWSWAGSSPGVAKRGTRQHTRACTQSVMMNWESPTSWEERADHSPTARTALKTPASYKTKSHS